MVDWVERVIAGFVAALGGVIWYWVKIQDRRDENNALKFTALNERLTDFELNHVTRTTIIQIESDWKDEINLLREERKEERLESRQALADIKRSIDENEQRNANTRHEIRDSVHAIALQLASLNARRGESDKP